MINILNNATKKTSLPSNAGSIANMGVEAIGGLIQGQNETGVGNAMSSIGSMASNIPGVGGLIGAGVNLLGHGVNAAFGSHINQEVVDQSKADVTSLRANAGAYNSNASLAANGPETLSMLSKKDVGTDGWFSNKAGRMTDRLNTQRKMANYAADRDYEQNVYNVDAMTDKAALGSIFAFGGQMGDEQTGQEGMMNVVGAGGSHEQNPMGGVPMGTDNSGTPNLVEEGEVIWDNYVFSKRIKCPEDVKKLVNGEGSTYAEVAESLKVEGNESLGDGISKGTMIDNLKRLKDSQEAQKAAREAKAMAMAAENQNEMKCGGKLATGGRMLAEGSYLWGSGNSGANYLSSTTIAPDGLPYGVGSDMAKFARVLNAANGDANLFKRAISGTGIKADKNGYLNNANLEIFKKLDMAKNPTLNYLATRARNIDTPDSIGITSVSNPNATQELLNSELKKPIADIQTPDYKNLGKEPFRLNFNGDASMLRYAPAVGSAIDVMKDALGLQNKPDYSNADAIITAASRALPQNVSYDRQGNLLGYTPTDRNNLLSLQQQQANATASAINNNANGNANLATLQRLALNAGTQRSLADTERQAQLQDEQRRNQVIAQNNALLGQWAQGAMQADTHNAQMKSTYDARLINAVNTAAQLRENIDATAAKNKSTNLAALYQNLGTIGKDTWLQNNINDSSLYGYAIDPTTGHIGFNGAKKEKALGGLLKKIKR